MREALAIKHAVSPTAGSPDENPADAPSRHAEPELPPSLLEQGWTLTRDEPVIRASIRRTPATEDLLALTDV